MSIYLLNGKDMYRQEERLASLLAEKKIEKDFVVRIDASNARAFDLEEALIECDTFSLFFFSSKKAVILKNPFFLNASSKEPSQKKTKKQNKGMDAKERRISMLERYLSQPNPDTDLFFYCHGFDADTRKKEYKLLMQYKAIVIRFDKMKSWEFEKYANEQVEKAGFSLDRSGREELLARVDGDTQLLHNALVKMDLYGARKLGAEDIRRLVPLNPEVNVFRLSRMFVLGDLKGVMQAKADMIRGNYDTVAMMNLLASRLRTLYNMKKLYEIGLSEDMIATRLKQKPYSVQMGLRDLFGLGSKDLLRFLNELAELDQGIKIGKTDAREGFDLFLLRNGNRNAGNKRIG